MAVSGKSARRLLKFLLTTDPPEIHAALEGLANQLDNDVEVLTGKLSERSTAKLFGRMFYVQGDATVENNGVLWMDLGATWVAVNTPATPQVYGAEVSRAEATEVVANASRATFVVLTGVGTLGKWISLTASVGGKNAGDVHLPGGTEAAPKAALSFIVPAGVKWSYVSTGLKELATSIYLPL